MIPADQTELGFLINLLLNHKLPKATRDALAERIRQVEFRLMVGPATLRPVFAAAAPLPPHQSIKGPAQSHSMQRILERNPDLAAALPNVESPAAPASQEPAPTQPAIVAQTPEAMRAMAARQEAMQQQQQAAGIQTAADVAKTGAEAANKLGLTQEAA